MKFGNVTGAVRQPILMETKAYRPPDCIEAGGADVVRIMAGEMCEERKDVHEIKKFLYQVRDSGREIQFLTRKIELTQDAAADCGEAQGKGLPSGNKGLKQTDTLYREIAQMEQELAAKEQDLREAAVRVADRISRLSDAGQKMILMKRYVDQQSWEKIALDLDMDVRTVQKLHGRALIELEDMEH